jgi:Bacterial capsule synthesis protein PGA_cap
MTSHVDQPTLSLVAGGDVGPVVQPVERLAELIAPVLDSVDFRIVQCERTYSDQGFLPSWNTIPHGRWSRLSPEYAAIYKAAKIDVASLASNHALDWSYQPLWDTLDLFADQGIRTVGAGRTQDDAHRPAVLEKNGVRVAVLAYCSVLRDGQHAMDGAPGVAGARIRTWYEPTDFQPGTPPHVHTEALARDVEFMQAKIAAAKADADAVVVTYHWGLRHVPKVLCEYQVPLGHALIDAGADVIVGHHPHTPKGIEIYQGKPIFYSIGNFMTTGSVNHREKPNARWGMYWYDWHGEDTLYGFPEHCRIALLPRLTFGKSGLLRASAVPIYMNNLAQPEPLTPDHPQFERLLNHMEWVSDQFEHQIDVDGDEFVVHDVSRQAAAV